MAVMKVFNQKTLRIEEVDESKVTIFNLHLGVEQLYGLAQFQKIDALIAEIMEDWKDYYGGHDYYAFNIVEDFGLLQTYGKKKEVEEFFIKICSLFLSHLFERDQTGNKIRSEHEFRLSVPKQLSAIKASELVKRDLANYKTKVEAFSVSLVNENGVKVFSPFEV